MRIAAALAILIPALALAFEPPSAEMQRAAVGDLDSLPPLLQRALAPDGPGFAPLPKPELGDWLESHDEKPESFAQFKASRPNCPVKAHSIVYLQPMGEFTAERSPALGDLKEFAAAFFGLEVKVLPPVPAGGLLFSPRRNPRRGNMQILTRSVLGWLETRLPADAFCILAVTMIDLYPAPTMNYVFGEATLSGRVGVFSFARYDPAFYGEPRTPEYKTVLAWRSAKVLAHEMGHMFGLPHCIYYRCLMNGMNTLEEDDAVPLHLCPVCLRKLQWSVGFDVEDRYENLLRVTTAAGFTEESGWLQKELKRIRGE